MTTMLVLLAMASTMVAQQPVAGASRGQETRTAQRKYQILVANEGKARDLMDYNNQVRSMQEASRDEAKRGLLLDLLWTGYTSAFTQKTVNASSNLVSLGVNYLVTAIKGEREKWYNTAQQHCHYSRVLSAESTIDDFYAMPSTKGSMDPENLKFQGFGCRNFIELSDTPGEGVDVFYVYCKMRRDEEGLRHIINHSKFIVELDTLAFTPKYCNLPNDSTGSAESRFDFAKRKNLTFTLKVRIFSSWINQATMITQDQQLGEFTVTARIDPKKLDSNGTFVYNRSDPDFEKLVSVEGDCFIVPRSFTGTTDAANYRPSWGTGQYRVEMEVSEDCNIVDEYYLVREAGNGEAVAFADATPGKKKWDKAKWKTEWNALKARRKGNSVWDNAWGCIINAYKGSGWVATLTDPMATSLYKFETTKLNDAFKKIHETSLPQQQQQQQMPK